MTYKKNLVFKSGNVGTKMKSMVWIFLSLILRYVYLLLRVNILFQFLFYLKKNCIFECKLRYIQKSCGCLPWFVLMELRKRRNVEIPVCNLFGNKYYEQKMIAANNVLYFSTISSSNSLIYIFSIWQQLFSLLSSKPLKLQSGKIEFDISI